MNRRELLGSVVAISTLGWSSVGIFRDPINVCIKESWDSWYDMHYQATVVSARRFYGTWRQGMTEVPIDKSWETMSIVTDPRALRVHMDSMIRELDKKAPVGRWVNEEPDYDEIYKTMYSWVRQPRVLQ